MGLSTETRRPGVTPASAPDARDCGMVERVRGQRTAACAKHLLRYEPEPLPSALASSTAALSNHCASTKEGDSFDSAAQGDGQPQHHRDRVGTGERIGARRNTVGR
jgi:hypothetical protein